MKKLIICMFTCLLAVAMVGCKKHKNVTTTVSVPLVVENAISLDRQGMYLQKSVDYTWYETSITLKNFLDSEETSSEVEKITNVFQVVEKVSETSSDVMVWIFEHTADGTIETGKFGFWIEDFPLNSEEIKLTFEDAYNRLMEANCPKPHSRQCILRDPIGPIEVNPQYIFGNISGPIYFVDAVTGAVLNYNPAFPTEES
jgi:hypothetical protein